MDEETRCQCGCCNGNPKTVLMGGTTGATEILKPGMTRSKFLKTLAAGALGLTTLSVIPDEVQSADAPEQIIVKGDQDVMIIDQAARELRISATVTKDPSKPSVIDWGRRFQAFFGSKGGKMESFFVFTTEVSRTDVDKAVKQLGVQSRRQIPLEEVEKRKGLKATTTVEDYLDGDPMICTIRFEKSGQIVEIYHGKNHGG